MNMYTRKRLGNKLSAYTVAKELGISRETYMEIEKGLKNLEGELLDKFNDIIARAKEINFNRMGKLQEVNKWFEDGEAIKALEKLGLTQYDLADALGISQCHVSYAVRNKTRIRNGKKLIVSDEVKEMIYDYLTNPLNKKVKQEAKTVKPKNKFKGISSIFRKELTIRDSETREPVETIEDKAKEYLVENDLVKETKITVIDIPVCEESHNNREEELLKEIERLKRQIMLYEKLIERL